MSKPKITIKVRPRAAPAPTPVPIDIDIDELLEFPMLDLRKDAGLIGDGDTSNSHILLMIEALIAVTVNTKASASPKDKVALSHKITSFSKARDAIRAYKTPITSGTQARKDIPGVGEGIAKRIDEFLTTGKVMELEKAIQPEAKIIMDLTTVTGIGEVKAHQLMTNFKVTSVQDLLKLYHSGQIQVGPNQITHHIEIGLRFYEDLQLRMPWSEADEIAKTVTSQIKKLNPQLIITVCGSYRRQRPTCGDIDVLVSHPDIKIEEQISNCDYLSKIVAVLEKTGLLVGHLTGTTGTKYMGVCRLPQPDARGRRIDIRFVPYNSHGAATLYFTGSGTLNKLMRFRANQRGFTLNEYGLYYYINNVKGALVPTPTEEDVFKTLRFVYLDPTQREF
jgi:DNA polymerase/3'-5' exonuclease PolX